MSADPFRTPALFVVQTQEIAACAWCRFRRAPHRRKGQALCASPMHSPPGDRTSVRDHNADGLCESFRPSLTTRIARLLGRRHPVLRHL